MTTRSADSQELVHSVLETLPQGEVLLVSLNDGDYARVAFNDSIGGHDCHCLDHFRSLLDSPTQGDLNHDHRGRGRFSVGWMNLRGDRCHRRTTDPRFVQRSQNVERCYPDQRDSFRRAGQ